MPKLHTHTATFEVPEAERPEALGRAGAFLQANGYTILSQAPLRAERGGEEAGWKVSEMTRLPASVEVRWARDGVLQLQAEVDVSGQVLGEGDKAYWAKEARALERAVIRGDVDRDLRPAERVRAQKTRRQSMVKALRVGVMCFVAMAMLGIALARFGCLGGA